jgi:methionine-rich copper-binding protein CopC
MNGIGTQTHVIRHVSRTAAVALCAGTMLLSGGGPASAHPNLISTSPKDGAALGSGPAAVVIAFDEAVRMAPQGARIVDQQGRTVPSTNKLSNKNKTLTITPSKRLGKGMYAAAYNLYSVEGHFVPGAVAFTVAAPTAKGSPVKVKPMPNVPTTIDGDRTGVRTITIATTLKSGEVTWRGPGIGEPLIWKLHGTGKKATATGVLPTAGTWTFEANLSTADNVMVPKGQVTLK